MRNNNYKKNKKQIILDFKKEFLLGNPHYLINNDKKYYSKKQIINKSIPKTSLFRSPLKKVKLKTLMNQHQKFNKILNQERLILSSNQNQNV